MWNSLDLLCPSWDVVEYPPQERYAVENLQEFMSILTSAADTLTSENPLWSEMGVLRNIQQKYKRILRCDKCLIHLQRVGHCLRKMVLLNLSKSYLDVAEGFLIGTQDPSVTLKLPSRQQVEYLLIRTLSCARLVCEAIKFSQESFCYLIQKLKVGHLILDLIMATSVTARLNILLRGTLENLSSLYKQVLSWRYKIKRGAFIWAEKLNFPEDISEWLKSFKPDYLKPLPVNDEEISRMNSLLSNLLSKANCDTNKKKKKESVESDSESVVIVDEISDKEETAAAGISRVSDIDYGEVVPRKKAKVDHHPNNMKDSPLQKLVGVCSLKELEIVWLNIRDSENSLPQSLTSEKRTVIDKLFRRIKKNVSVERFNKTYNGEPPFFKFVSVICSHLGFSENIIKLWRKAHNISSKRKNRPKSFAPVKKLKDLKVLYEQLEGLLVSKKKSKKLRLLKRLFELRMSDIRLLRRSGKKDIAKELIFCSSEEFLALCS